MDEIGTIWTSERDIKVNLNTNTGAIISAIKLP